MKNIMKALRMRFTTGLLVSLPLVATFFALRFVLRSIDGLLLPLIERFLGYRIPGLGIILTLLLILLIGLVTTNFLGRRIVHYGERILSAVPLVGHIHRAAKDIVDAFAVPDRQVFREVVLVEYPRTGLRALGFLTSRGSCTGPHGRQAIAYVFIPNPPIPTTGALVAVPLDQVSHVDMTVEEALKLIISVGMVAPKELTMAPGESSG